MDTNNNQNAGWVELGVVTAISGNTRVSDMYGTLYVMDVHGKPLYKFQANGKAYFIEKFRYRRTNGVFETAEALFYVNVPQW